MDVLHFETAAAGHVAGSRSPTVAMDKLYSILQSDAIYSNLNIFIGPERINKLWKEVNW